MNTQSEKFLFIRSLFGEIKIARDSINVAVTCPACCGGNRKKKFSINTDTWACHCWVCGIKSYNLFYVIKKHLCPQKANLFLTSFGVILKDNAVSTLQEVDRVINLPKGFCLLADLKTTDPDMRACISYLFRRGLTREDFWYFKIGSTPAGRLRRRVIVPSFDSKGELNYFVSRAIDRENKIKYVNSKNKKTEIIFNDINIDWSKELTLVEGPFDLFKVSQNATCLLGSKLSERSLLFKKIIENKTPILLALDPDMRAESHKIALSLFNFDCKVRIVNNKLVEMLETCLKMNFLSWQTLLLHGIKMPG